MDDPNVHFGVKSVLHATRVHFSRRSINYSRESSKLITSSLISSSLNYQINYRTDRQIYRLEINFHILPNTFNYFELIIHAYILLVIKCQ